MEAPITNLDPVRDPEITKDISCDQPGTLTLGCVESYLIPSSYTILLYVCLLPRRNYPSRP